MDVEKGPDVLRQIAKVLKEAGFDVVEDEHIPCVWYNSLGVERIKQFHERKYEFDEYIPGFTKEQKELMISKLDSFITEFGGSDEELKHILQGYHDGIRDYTIIDRKWLNQTDTQ
jgi:hypothetical protein